MPILLRLGCPLLLLAARPALAQRPAAGPDSVRTVALAGVQVRPPRVQVLRAPGEATGVFSHLAYSLTPTRRVAVWYPLPADSAYRVRAVRVQLASRLPETPADLVRHRRQFAEGCLAVWLAPATTNGQPADTSLLPAPLLLPPAASEATRHGWVRLEVPGAALPLPPGGVFVVVECRLGPGERFVRSRLLQRPPDAHHPPQDMVPRPGASQRTYPYEELLAADNATRLVPASDYPALVQLRVAASAECRTWHHQPLRGRKVGWQALTISYAQARQAAPRAALHEYNYALELEVESP